MHEDVASFLKYQIERSAERGDMEEAAAKLYRFLELERNAHSASQGLRGSEGKVRNMPRIRSAK